MIDDDYSPLFEEDVIEIGKLIDDILRSKRAFRLKYDGNVDHGIELLYSHKATGENYRITIVREVGTA